MPNFRSRGHYCNYCRKVVDNKTSGSYHHHILNTLLWHVWDNSPSRVDELVLDIVGLTPCITQKQFNSQVKALYSKYGAPKHKG